jgi:hypothetical protein
MQFFWGRFSRHKGEQWIILCEREGSPQAPRAMIHRTPSGYPSAGCSSAEPASVSPDKTRLLRSFSGVKRPSSFVLLHRQAVPRVACGIDDAR